MLTQRGEGLVEFPAAGLVEPVVRILQHDLSCPFEDLPQEDEFPALAGTELPVAFPQRIGHGEGLDERRSFAAGREKGCGRGARVRSVEIVAVIEAEFLLVDLLLHLEGDDPGIFRQEEAVGRGRHEFTADEPEELFYAGIVSPVEAPGLVGRGGERGYFQGRVSEVADLHGECQESKLKKTTGLTAFTALGWAQERGIDEKTGIASTVGGA